MNKKYHPALRVISSFLLVSFFFHDVSFAAIDLKPTEFNFFQKPLISFQIPLSVARVEDTLRLSGKKTVFLIQDAHTNESGQFNAAKTLDLILRSQKIEDRIKYVFLEAGTGDDSLTFLRDKAPLDKRKEVADSYLKKGVLSGSEYLDLTSDLHFVLWGVENKELYWKALRAYEAVAKGREKFQDYLKRIQTTIETLKPRIFNPSLLAFEEKRDNFIKENISLTDYFEILTKEAEKRNIPLDYFPHLSALKSLRAEEKAIDFKVASEEQLKAVEAASPEDAQALLSASQETHSPFKFSSADHKIEKAFYTLLEEILTREAVSDDRLAVSANRQPLTVLYPELTKYFAYLKEASKINPKEILAEQKLLENQIYDSLISTDDERYLHKSSENLRALKNLFNLTLTPDEFKVYQDDPKGFDTAFITGFLNKKIMDLKNFYERAVFLENGYEDYIKHAEEFYTLTVDRDRAFIDNLTKKMDDENQTQSVLIAGGYHTPNLKALLKERNISYVVVTPQIFHETNHERYEKLLLAQKPELPLIPSLNKEGRSADSPSFVKEGARGSLDRDKMAIILIKEQPILESRLERDIFGGGGPGIGGVGTAGGRPIVERIATSVISRRVDRENFPQTNDDFARLREEENVAADKTRKLGARLAHVETGYEGWEALAIKLAGLKVVKTDIMKLLGDSFTHEAKSSIGFMDDKPAVLVVHEIDRNWLSRVDSSKKGPLKIYRFEENSRGYQRLVLIKSDKLNSLSVSHRYNESNYDFGAISNQALPFVLAVADANSHNHNVYFFNPLTGDTLPFDNGRDYWKNWFAVQKILIYSKASFATVVLSNNYDSRWNTSIDLIKEDDGFVARPLRKIISFDPDTHYAFFYLDEIFGILRNAARNRSGNLKNRISETTSDSITTISIRPDPRKPESIPVVKYQRNFSTEGEFKTYGFIDRALIEQVNKKTVDVQLVDGLFRIHENGTMRRISSGARLAETHLSEDQKSFLRQKRYIAVVAPPFAGKGTQLEWLEQELNEGFTDPRDKFVRLEMGAYFRGALYVFEGKIKPEDKNPDYDRFKELSSLISATDSGDFERMKSGQLMKTADQVVNRILSWLQYAEARGILIDGFPRTMDQVRSLEQNKIEINGRPLFVGLNLIMEVPQETLLQRSSNDRGLRPDASKTDARLKAFREETAPVIEALKNLPNTVRINADNKLGPNGEALSREASIEAVRREEIVPGIENAYMDSLRRNSSGARLALTGENVVAADAIDVAKLLIPGVRSVAHIKDRQAKIDEMKKLKTVVLLVRSATIVDDDLINQLTDLKHIVRWGHGTDNITVSPALLEARGIKVIQKTRGSKRSITAWVLRAIGFASQKGSYADADKAPVSFLTTQTFWNAFDENSPKSFKTEKERIAAQAKSARILEALKPETIEALKGQTIGLIGAGDVGLEIAFASRELGLNVKMYSPSLESDETKRAEFAAKGYSFATIDDILATSNFVVPITGLTDETRSMINARRVEILIKNKSLVALINPDREDLVVEDAILRLLNERKDVKYVVDEVPTLEALKELAFYTPHIGGTTKEAKEDILVNANKILERIFAAENGARLAIEGPVVAEAVTRENALRNKHTFQIIVNPSRAGVVEILVYNILAKTPLLNTKQIAVIQGYGIAKVDRQKIADAIKTRFEEHSFSDKAGEMKQQVEQQVESLIKLLRPSAPKGARLASFSKVVADYNIFNRLLSNSSNEAASILALVAIKTGISLDDIYNAYQGYRQSVQFNQGAAANLAKGQLLSGVKPDEIIGMYTDYLQRLMNRLSSLGRRPTQYEVLQVSKAASILAATEAISKESRGSLFAIQGDYLKELKRFTRAIAEVEYEAAAILTEAQVLGGRKSSSYPLTLLRLLSKKVDLTSLNKGPALLVLAELVKAAVLTKTSKSDDVVKAYTLFEDHFKDPSSSTVSSMLAEAYLFKPSGARMAQTIPVLEKDRRFEIKFGTSGWRDETQKGFTRHNVGRFAQGLVKVLKSEPKPIQNLKIAVGYDARPLAPDFAKLIVEVLAANGIRADLIDQVTPTPIAAESTRDSLPKKSRYDLALHVTPSHNSVFVGILESIPDDLSKENLWMGIKVLRNGVPADDKFTGKIAKAAKNIAQYKRLPYESIPSNLSKRGVDLIGPSNARLRDVFDFKKIKANLKQLSRTSPTFRNFGVLIDSMHGATSEPATVIGELGVLEEHFRTTFIRDEVRNKTLPLKAMDPRTGYEVPWRPEPQKWLLAPELQKPNPGKLIAGLDGDGDRAYFVDINGKVLEPNDLGLIFAHYLITRRNVRGPIVRTIPTTHLLDRLAQKYGLTLEETSVGSKHFAPYVGNMVVGIEESSHIFFQINNETFADSAIAQIVLALEIISEKGMSLSDYLKEIRQELIGYSQQNYPQSAADLVYMRTGLEADRVANLSPKLKELRNQNEVFAVSLAKTVAQKAGKTLKLREGQIADGTTYDLRDKGGIKINFNDGTWAMYRISGTDNSWRIYAEGESQESLIRLTNAVKDTLLQVTSGARLAVSVGDIILLDNKDWPRNIVLNVNGGQIEYLPLTKNVLKAEIRNLSDIQIKVIPPRDAPWYPFNPGDKITVRWHGIWRQGTIVDAQGGNYEIVTYERFHTGGYAGRVLSVSYSGINNKGQDGELKKLEDWLVESEIIRQQALVKVKNTITTLEEAFFVLVPDATRRQELIDATDATTATIFYKRIDIDTILRALFRLRSVQRMLESSDRMQKPANISNVLGLIGHAQLSLRDFFLKIQQQLELVNEGSQVQIELGEASLDRAGLQNIFHKLQIAIDQSEEVVNLFQGSSGARLARQNDGGSSASLSSPLTNAKAVVDGVHVGPTRSLSGARLAQSQQTPRFIPTPVRKLKLADTINLDVHVDEKGTLVVSVSTPFFANTAKLNFDEAEVRKGTGNTLTIGRNNDNNFVLPPVDSTLLQELFKTVSRKHAVIQTELLNNGDLKVIVKDLSSYGTFVDGVRVAGEKELFVVKRDHSLGARLGAEQSTADSFSTLARGARLAEREVESAIKEVQAGIKKLGSFPPLAGLSRKDNDNYYEILGIAEEAIQSYESDRDKDNFILSLDDARIQLRYWLLNIEEKVISTLSIAQRVSETKVFHDSLNKLRFQLEKLRGTDDYNQIAKDRVSDLWRKISHIQNEFKFHKLTQPQANALGLDKEEFERLAHYSKFTLEPLEGAFAAYLGGPQDNKSLNHEYLLTKLEELESTFYEMQMWMATNLYSVETSKLDLVWDIYKDYARLIGELELAVLFDKNATSGARLARQNDGGAPASLGSPSTNAKAVVDGVHVGPTHSLSGARLAAEDLTTLKKSVKGNPEFKALAIQQIVHESGLFEINSRFNNTPPTEKAVSPSVENAPNLENLVEAINEGKLSFGLVQVALANTTRLKTLPTNKIAVLLRDQKSPSILGLKLEKIDGKDTLIVTQLGLKPVFIDVKEVLKDVSGNLSVRIKNSDLMNLTRMRDAAIGQSLAETSGVNESQPVHVKADLGIFGDIKKYTIYFDIFSLDALRGSRHNSHFQNVSFSLQSSDPGLLALADARLAELDDAYGFNGALRALFVTEAPVGAQIVNLVPADQSIVPQPGYRYLPVQPATLGDISSYFGGILVAIFGGRIKISKGESVDSHFKHALEILSGTIFENDGVLISIIEGTADRVTRIKHAIKALTRVGLEYISQWYKNTLAFARSA